MYSLFPSFLDAVKNCNIYKVLDIGSSHRRSGCGKDSAFHCLFVILYFVKIITKNLFSAINIWERDIYNLVESSRPSNCLIKYLRAVCSTNYNNTI